MKGFKFFLVQKKKMHYYLNAKKPLVVKDAVLDDAKDIKKSQSEVKPETTYAAIYPQLRADSPPLYAAAVTRLRHESESPAQVNVINGGLITHAPEQLMMDPPPSFLSPEEESPEPEIKEGVLVDLSFPEVPKQEPGFGEASFGVFSRSQITARGEDKAIELERLLYAPLGG